MKNKTVLSFAWILILFSISGMTRSIANQDLNENSKAKNQLYIVSVPVSLEAFQTQAGVVTSPVKNITSNSATSGYTIKANGVKITAHGICLSKGPSPAISNTKYAADKAPGPTFNVQLTGLTPGMKFYIRSFITTAAGTVYGNELSFTTLQAKK